MFNAGSAVSKLLLDTSDFRHGFLQAESLMKVFPATVTNFMASPLLGVVGIAGQVGRALGGMVSDALTTGVKLAASFEQAEVALGTMLGGAAQAKAVLGDLSAFAAATPFELPELVEATKKLTAFGIEHQALIPTLKSIGDISAGLGIRVSDLADIYGKARVQGRLFMEDINQLAGRGIPIQQELARQFGVTGDQVRKLVETGSVNFGNLQEAFRNLTAEGGKFGGMMDAQSKTLNGLWSTLTDNYNSLLREVGTDLVKAFDLRGVIQSAADYILSNKGAIVGAVREVTAGVVELLGILKDVAAYGKPAFEFIQAKLDGAGITDPNNRTAVKNPYAGASDPGFMAGLDKSAVLGTAPGREFLNVLVREQLAAAQAIGGVDEAMAKLSYGEARTRRAAEIALEIEGQTKAYRATLNELDAMLGKPAAEIPAEQFDAVVAKVNAFGASLRTASDELAKLRNQIREATGDNASALPGLEAGIGGFTSAMDAIRSRRGLVSDLARFPRAAAAAGLAPPPDAEPPLGPLAPQGPLGASTLAGGAGGGGGTAAGAGGAQPLQAAFAALTHGVLAARDSFADLRDSLKDFADDLTKLAVEVIRPLVTEGAAGQQKGSGGGEGGPMALGNVNVTTPPFNMNEATSQVAGKLRPSVNAAFENLRREFQGAMFARDILDSMRD